MRNRNRDAVSLKTLLMCEVEGLLILIIIMVLMLLRVFDGLRVNIKILYVSIIDFAILMIIGFLIRHLRTIGKYV